MNPYTKALPDDVAAKHAQALSRSVRDVSAPQRRDWSRDDLGRNDSNSWLNNFPVRGRTEYATLFDRAGQPKAAFFAVRDAALAAQKTPMNNQMATPRPRNQFTLAPPRLPRAAPMRLRKPRINSWSRNYRPTVDARFPKSHRCGARQSRRCQRKLVSRNVRVAIWLFIGVFCAAKPHRALEKVTGWPARSNKVA